MKMQRKEISLSGSLVILFSVMLSASILSGCDTTQLNDDGELAKGFVNPPATSKPRVWWHWMNGNITKEGIKADLLWMHRTGIGGFQNFDAALMTPQIVAKRLIYMTPEWKDAFGFTTRLADSLGLEMAIAGSPGWSESGGPWVIPSHAMKKLVWSETEISGGKEYSGILPKPPKATGPFQNLPVTSVFSLMGGPKRVIPEYYADAAVIAYRIPEQEKSLRELNPEITSSGGRFYLNDLTDGDLVRSSYLPPAKLNEKAWVQFKFSEPIAIQGLTIVGGGSAGIFGFGRDADNRELEASNDGVSFSTVTAIPSGGPGQRTISFPPVTAQYFRFTFKTLPPPPGPGNLIGLGDLQMPKEPRGTDIAELVLYTGARVNRFEDKAAYVTADDQYKLQTPAVKNAVPLGDVIDISSKMDSTGRLTWTPAEGRWMVLRLGYSLTGHENSPASPEATGLEVDKLNGSYVKDYFEKYLDQYKDATGGLMGSKGLHYVITDSWEAGVQNWTDSMIYEFKKRRGYDIVRWLPVMTGRVVNDPVSSDRFLWDLRKTIGDLTVEKHYDQLTSILKARGMARYSESHENGRAFIGDGMEVKRKAEIPMSATWTPGGFNGGEEVSAVYKADVRESASVAHIYGQNLVAAESMTAIGTAWAWSPELLKPTADMELSNGLNRFVIHTSVHQPVDDKIPGLGLGPFGQWFTRHETWAEEAAPWITYLSRSSYMLQQGRFVADILWYYGEDNNITSLYINKSPEIPEGYNYDFINSDALLNLLSVKDGKLITPSGMEYSLLVLDPNATKMTLPILKKISDLVKSGAKVTGSKPDWSPSLSDNQEEFAKLSAEIWDKTGDSKPEEGKVITGVSIGATLEAMKISPDFSLIRKAGDTKVLFVHRKAGNTEIYWLNNRNDKNDDIVASFRVEGREPEIWDPVSGEISKTSYKMTGARTDVNINLKPSDALFVIFRERTTVRSYTLPEMQEKQIADLSGPWDVRFLEGRGAPATARFDKLSDWKDNADQGIKYFSGTASYTRAIDVPDAWMNGNEELVLDLGEVKNLATVVINGKDAGILWKKPFRMNIKTFLHAGSNNIEVKVTNLWVNRLIGDQQPGIKEKYTYTTMQFYKAESPLLSSGLLGPVKLTGLSEKK